MKKSFLFYAPILYPWMIDLYEILVDSNKNESGYFITLGIYGNYPNWKKLEKKNTIIIPKKIKIGNIKSPNFSFYKDFFFKYKTRNVLLLATESIPSLVLIFLSKLQKRKTILIIEENTEYFRLVSGVRRFLFLLKRFFVILSYICADTFIAESAKSKSYLRTLHVKKPIYVYPHGVNTRKFYPRPYDYVFADSLGLKKDHCINVLYLGGMNAHKGYVYLLKALEKLEQTKYRLIAPVLDINKFQECIRKYNIENTLIIPLVNLQNLPKLYSISDVVISPSIRYWGEERSPNVVIEAMASGVVVIGTNVGGIPSMIGDSGIIIEEKSFLAIKTAIETLINNPHIKKEYENKAVERIRSYLNLDSYAKFILKLFK